MIKRTLYDQQGNIVEQIDTRTLEYTRQQRINTAKMQCEAHILKHFPDHKQKNAQSRLLGFAVPDMTDAEARAILQGVSDAIARYEAVKAAVAQATTNDEADAVEF